MISKYFMIMCCAFYLFCNTQIFAADSYVVGAGATVTIDEHSVCKKVSNSLGAGVMVPIKTANEWHTGGKSFLENLYTGVSAAGCSSGLIPCGSFTELGDMIPASLPAFDQLEHTYAYAYHPSTGKVISAFLYGSGGTRTLQIMAITPPNGSTILQSTLDTSRLTIASGNLALTDVRILNNYIFISYTDQSNSNNHTYHQLIYGFDGTNFTFIDELAGAASSHNIKIYTYDGAYYYGQDTVITAPSHSAKLASWQITGGVLTQISVSAPVGFGKTDSGSAFFNLLYDNGYILVPYEGYIRAYIYDGATFTAVGPAQQLDTTFHYTSNITKYGDKYVYSVNWGSNIRIFEFNGTNFTFTTSLGHLGDGTPHIQADNEHIFFANRKDLLVSDETHQGIGAAYLNDSTQKIDIAEYQEFPEYSSAVALLATSPSRITYGNKYYEYVTGTCGGGASCTLPVNAGGGTIPDGKSIPAYAVASGAACEEEFRECTNGTLSGTNQYIGCEPPIKVICTHYHAKEMLSDYLYDGEKIYAETVDPRIMIGYHYWAIPTVKWLEKNAWIDPIIAPLVRGWATEVNYRLNRVEKGSVIGKVLLGVAEPVSAWIADMVVEEDVDAEAVVEK